jgi:hypothetical protein
MNFTTENVAVPIMPLALPEPAHTSRPEMLSSSFKNVKLRSRCPTSLASSEASANDGPLFMTSKAAKGHRRSLSHISNRSVRRADRGSEPNFKTQPDLTRENMAWDVINTEISEWQNVCQTGRPSWSSPASNWTRNGVRSTWREDPHAIPFSRLNLDHVERPRQRYDALRRAVTDSYLADSNNVQEIAQLVAIQLLSACFTLPPDHISSHKSSAYRCFDTLGADDIRDSRLISSLQMHTEARYSPSFGHQARNTSPADFWHGAYDGSTRSRSSSPHRQSTDADSLTRTARRRVHRASHTTDKSASNCSMDSHSGYFDHPGSSQTAETSRTLRERQGTRHNDLPSSSGRSIQSAPVSPGGSGWHMRPMSTLSPRTGRAQAGHEGGQLSRGISMHQQTPRFTLKPVIRSEPHHVYVQPVRELVIKRWQTLRGRFRRTRSQGGPETSSLASRAMSSTAGSGYSTPGERSFGSPFLSSDAKERRRRARERGDIHSSSVESSPRYNTPTSADGSGTASPLNFELYSSYHENGGRSRADIAKALTSAGINGLSNSPSQSFTPPNSHGSPVPSPPPALTGSLSSRVGSPTKSGTSNPRPSPSVPSFSPRRQGARRQRRSMLSEVCTPDDIEEERNDLSVVGSALASPREESGSDSLAGSGPVTPTLDMLLRDEASAASSPGPVTSMSAHEEVLNRRWTTSGLQRPRLHRVSSSGTQIFTPHEDGVEIDGLPVGPAADTWDDIGDGKRRERSFL